MIFSAKTNVSGRILSTRSIPRSLSTLGQKSNPLSEDVEEDDEVPGPKAPRDGGDVRATMARSLDLSSGQAKPWMAERERDASAAECLPFRRDAYASGLRGRSPRRPRAGSRSVSNHSIPPWLLNGGERGIRTLDTGLTVYTLSKRAPSTTRPSLRIRKSRFSGQTFPTG